MYLPAIWPLDDTDVMHYVWWRWSSLIVSQHPLLYYLSSARGTVRSAFAFLRSTTRSFLATAAPAKILVFCIIRQFVNSRFLPGGGGNSWRFSRANDQIEIRASEALDMNLSVYVSAHYSLSRKEINGDLLRGVRSLSLSAAQTFCSTGTRDAITFYYYSALLFMTRRNIIQIKIWTLEISSELLSSCVHTELARIFHVFLPRVSPSSSAFILCAHVNEWCSHKI